MNTTQMNPFQLIISLLLFSISLPAQRHYGSAMQTCRMLGYEESQECMIGVSLPPFELITLDGNPVSNDSLSGSVTVIHFWFTSCTPCIAELDGLNKVVARYDDRKDVRFLSITMDDKALLDSDFFPNYQLDFPIVPDAGETIMQTFQIGWGFPTTMVIDRNGKIFRIFSGGKTEPEEASREVLEHLSTLLDECLMKKTPEHEQGG